MQKGHYCEIAYLKTGVLRRSDLISVILFEVLRYSYLITWQDMEADNSTSQSEKKHKTKYLYLRRINQLVYGTLLFGDMLILNVLVRAVL